jgi:phage terminase large subunit
MIAQPATRTRPAPDVRLAVEIRGAPARLFREAHGEIVISGPAGTGKTRAILEWIHHRCSTEHVRFLILRKTLESLKASALVTFQEQVLHDFDGRRSVADGVTYFGGNKLLPAQFIYEATGSVIVIGGMDRSSKVLSTEYNGGIYVNEITELTLDEFEKLTGRTDRPTVGAAPPPSLVLGDCNPDRPTHWIKQRAGQGKLKLWNSVHEDNPSMWNRVTKQWTEAGKRYLARLDNLTGVRYLRLRKGIWAAAEGVIYEEWDENRHVVDRYDIPYGWPRIWGVDFGYVNPFVWQAWAIKPDGEMVMYREIYLTRRLVSDLSKLILTVSANDPPPVAIIVDHDAEDRATFEAETGYETTAARKSVSPGLQKMALRLRGENDKPRMTFMKDSLVHDRDQDLVDRGKPSCTVDEIPGYVWDTSQGRNKGEQPVKLDDHGCDTARYVVAELDSDEPDDWQQLSDEELRHFNWTSS